MNKNLSNEEFVNRYIDNELSDIDRLNFENKLLQDPELREEYNLQSDLINGIKEARRLELKSRLMNIPIQTPIYQTIGFKAVAIAGITGLGIGIYFMSAEKDNIQLSPVDIAQNQISVTENNAVPEIPKAITPIKENKPQKEEKSNIVAQKKPKSDTLAKNTKIKSKSTTVQPKVVEPNVIQPNIVETFDNEDIEAGDISIDNQDNNLDRIKENVESAVEITTIKDRKNKFHYKFYENKLFLLGNFNDMPYEILELNSSKGKSYYLFYNENFYKLNSGQEKPAPLIKIENDSLVNELKIIQSNQHQ